MRCTVLSTMDRPRPAPAAAVRAESPRKNGLGQVGQLFWGDTRAMVAQLDQHPALAALGDDVHAGDACFLGFAIAPGVFQQVGDHAGQLHFVGQHVQILGHVHGDLQFPVVLYGIYTGRNHRMQIDGCERDMVGPRVVEELVDGGVKLHDVGHHVLAGHFVVHAHLGFQPQPRQRRAQIVRNARQHHGAVLFQFGEFLGHAVEADVHLADFAGHHFFIQMAGSKIAILDPVGRIGQLLKRAVDQACNGSGARQRECGSRDEPYQPGATTGRAEA